MSDNKNFKIPDELLEAVNGGVSFTPFTDNTINEKLDAGVTPCCGTPIILINRTNQQPGTGMINEYYYCGSCNKIYQKIIYLTKDYVWGELKV